jgi:hypothetical protein
MASLSNINGIFDVHSTGAILFSTSHGTSGQILRSNGNAAPTWVDASTVIGGPYLPLTGGTLTGPLAGTSATFSGNVLLGSNNNIPMDASANGQLMVDGVGYQGAIALDDQAMHIYHNSSSRSLILGTNETARLTINGSGNSTFAGTVTVGSGSQAVNSDAMLTLRATAYSGLDIKSARTTGNIGGIRFYDTASNTVPEAQLNVEVDGSYNFYNGTNGAQLRLKITDYGSLVVGNTPGTNSNWGKIQCGGTITVGNSSGTYVTHGRISGDSDGMKLKGTSTGTYSNPQGVTINGYNVGINTDSPNVGNAYGLVIRSFTNPSRLVFWNNTSGEVSSRGQRISFENANCIFENMESGYYAFKTGGSGANPSERARFNNVGQLLINATTSGYSTNNYGYMLGVRGTTSQAVISVAKSNQTLDTQGVLFGLSNSEAFIVNRDNTPLRFHTNNVPTMTILANGDVGIGTTTPSQPLDVSGYSICNKQFQRDNTLLTILNTPRVLNIGYRGANGTYTFNPVTLFGSNAQGGQCVLQVTGWRAALNNGIIHWVDNGSNTNIGAGSVYYTQTAYKLGGQNGSNTISVSNSSGTNNITITFTGWHSNGHGWNCKIISYQA